MNSGTRLGFAACAVSNRKWASTLREISFTSRDEREKPAPYGQGVFFEYGRPNIALSTASGSSVRTTKSWKSAFGTTRKREGSSVMIEAEHSCMTMRGVNTPGSNLITSRDRLDQLIVRADSIVTNLQHGEGTVGKLLTDESLYNNVNNFSSEGVKLLYDFRQNPKKYLTIKFELF